MRPSRLTMTMASGADSSRPRNFASTFLRSLMSRMAAVAKIPSSVASGERLISAGEGGASRGRPDRASPLPLGGGGGPAKEGGGWGGGGGGETPGHTAPARPAGT